MTGCWLVLATIAIVSRLALEGMAKPTTVADLKVFDSTVRNVNNIHSFEKAAAIDRNRKREQDRGFTGIEAESEQQATGNHSPAGDRRHVNHQMRVDPYGPEPVERRHGKSVTEVIEELNKKGKDRVFVEGDVVVSVGNSKRVAASNVGMRWPQGVVPYSYDINFPYKSVVEVSMSILMQKTCLAFRPRRSGDAHAVKFVNKEGCYSYVGLQSDTAEQEISIGDGCENTDTIIHEIMHAIGFWHEQNRPDRDDYLNIRMENVELGMEENFKKRTTAESVVFKPYDYLSLMQYGNTDFSKNGMNTMEAKNDPSMQLGQTVGSGTLTASDIAEVNALYSCTNIVTNGNWGAWSALSHCSASCGIGTATRTRQCNNPSPSNGGSTCQGSSHHEEACSIGLCSTSGTSCSFETNTCGWTSTTGSGGNALVWARLKGSTPSIGTGPREDKTTGSTNGYYMYLQTPDTYSGVQVAHGLLKSPMVPSLGAGKKRCLSYNVHMRGQGMGTLHVKVINLDRNTETLLRKHEGNHKDQWYFNELNVDGSSSIKIIFQGFKGNSWQSNMALDDIAITDVACSSGLHDCDFEASTCSWTISNLEYYPLLLNTDETPSAEYADSMVAKNGAGYLFADGYSEDAWKGDESSITSALIEMPASGSICLSFWYHMDGADIGTLSVNAVTQAGSYEICQTSADEGLEWVQRRLSVAVTEPIQVMFVVRRGGSQYGDIGLDSIVVQDGTC